MKVTGAFKQNIMGILGDQGPAWLDQLDSVIQHLARRWELTDIKPFENLSYSYVALAYSAQSASSVVLKICITESTYTQEQQALQFYQGIGCVKLLDFDKAHNAMLLEAIEPGISLRSSFPKHDMQAIESTVTVMKQLHAHPLPQPHGFRTMDDWLSLFHTLEVPDALKSPVQRARDIAKRLRQTQQSEHLLHGDLHHDNILEDRHGTWKAIDPKGVVGESAYEVGAFMCNPAGLLEHASAKDIIHNRLDAFSRLLTIDRQRLLDACYVRIILSACWSVEDKADWNSDLRCAKLLD